MPDQKIRGVIVPILTPLNSDETVDTQSLRRLVNYLIDNGVHGIWASGNHRGVRCPLQSAKAHQHGNRWWMRWPGG